MKQTISVKMPGWSGWILVPLRLFLGVTFVYAGVQKLTDPQYFNPAARGYIGHQIAAFALGSPLRGFLTNVAVPHATFSWNPAPLPGLRCSEATQWTACSPTIKSPPMTRPAQPGSLSPKTRR